MQALLTVGVTATILALVLMNRPVPDQLWNCFWTILGFFFGSKVTAASFKAANPNYY